MKKALTRNNNKNHKLIGMHDGLRGDCSGLRGNCSELRGNLDECEISREDRENGVSIEVLISDD